MAAWNADIVGVEHSDVARVGTESNVQVDLSLGRPVTWSGFNDDYCRTRVVVGGIDLEIVVFIDGVESGKTTHCAGTLGGGSERSYNVQYDVPSTPGVYDVNIRVVGAGSGDVEATYTFGLEVQEESDPQYNLTISAPSAVDARESFSVEALITCENGDCPQESWELMVAGESIDDGTIDFVNLEQQKFTYGPEGVWINEPGDHTVTLEVGSKSTQTTITVRETGNDPPFDPLPGDGGGNGGNGGGRDIPWAAVALAGGLALSSRGDGGSPDDVTEGESNA